MAWLDCPAALILLGWAKLVELAGLGWSGWLGWLDCPTILILLSWAELVELVELAGLGWPGWLGWLAGLAELAGSLS